METYIRESLSKRGDSCSVDYLIVLPTTRLPPFELCRQTRIKWYFKVSIKWVGITSVIITTHKHIGRKSNQL